MDAPVIIAIIAGIPGTLGLIFQQINRRTARREKAAAAAEIKRLDELTAPDRESERIHRELDDCMLRIDSYIKHLTESDHVIAELRKDVQSAWEASDRYCEDARTYKRKYEDCLVRIGELERAAERGKP